MGVVERGFLWYTGGRMTEISNVRYAKTCRSES